MPRSSDRRWLLVATLLTVSLLLAVVRRRGLEAATVMAPAGEAALSASPLPGMDAATAVCADATPSDCTPLAVTLRYVRAEPEPSRLDFFLAAAAVLFTLAAALSLRRLVRETRR